MKMLKAVQFQETIMEILEKYGFHVLSTGDAISCIDSLCANMNYLESLDAIQTSKERQ